MRTARLSINGLHMAYPDLYDGLQLPPQLDKDTLTARIDLELGELEILYPDPCWMQRAIRIWSTSNLRSWTCMVEALLAEYNAVHNYDRTEEWTTDLTHEEDRQQTHQGSSGSNSTFTGGTVSIESSNTKGRKAAFNQDGMTPADETQSGGQVDNRNNSETNGTAQESTNTSETNKDTDTELRKGRAYGNIGVTTSQQMITEEILLRSKYNIYDIILQQFKAQFCIRVY